MARRTSTAPSAEIPAYRMVEDDRGLDALIEELVGEARYGIDTEFVRERTYFARLALMQISWSGPRHCTRGPAEL